MNAREKMGMHSLNRLVECWTLVHQNESLLCQQELLALVLIVTILMISCNLATLKSHSREVCACTPSGLSTTLDRRIATTIFSTTSCILPTLCLVVLQKDEPCQLHPPSTTATPSELRYRNNMQATHKIR